MIQVKLIDNKPSEWLAHRFYVLGQFDMCINVVEQILRRTPDNPEALSLKGSVLRTRGYIDEALNCFQTAYTVDTQNIRHLLEIAKCLFFLGRYQQSLKILNQLEDSPEGNIWEVYHLIGQNNARLKKLKEAADAFQNALDTDLRIETFLELMNVYEQQRDFSSFQSLMIEALKIHGNNTQLRRRIGKFLIGRQQNSVALSHLKFAYEKDPTDCQAYLLAGSIEQENTHIQEALDLYRRSFSGLSNSPALWTNVALCIQTRSRLEAVIACCKRAAFYAPFEGLPLTNMGLVFLEMGLYCSAAIYLRRAKNLDPSCKGVGEGLAMALMNLKQYDEAIQIFNSELQKGYSHQTLINLAICFYKAGRAKEANAAFEKFQKLMAEEPSLEANYPLKKILIPMFTDKSLPVINNGVSLNQKNPPIVA